MTWTGGTYSVSPNGNALRFATLYNFYFDANSAPTTANATLGLFKPGVAGDPASIAIAAQGPSSLFAATDFNHDGATNAADLAVLLGNWGGTGTGDLNGDGVINAADLAILLAAWN